MFGRAFSLLASAALMALGTADAASFGYTTVSGKWVITTGAGLSISMRQSTCDIVSMSYNGKELQYNSMGTHVNSGLGTTASSAISTLSDADKTIQVTCAVSATGITQYYFFRPNENAVYMGTYHASNAATTLPEMRFIARMDKSVMPNGVGSEVVKTADMTAIEAEDVYATSKNLTQSKFYSGIQFMDDNVHGVTSSAASVYLVMSDRAYETSSGGPFFRDINNKVDVSNELSFYMNSDHTRIEDYRYGFHGPYALVVGSSSTSSSSAAKSVDFSFFQSLSLTGFVPDSKRGTVTGTITDAKTVIGSSDTVVVTWSNSAAQYWTKLSAGGRSFTSPKMKPGTYTMKVYKKQLEVASVSSVVVSAGAATKANAAVSYSLASSPIWRIGTWDGTPDEFLNADKIHKMHPSDYRMSAWKAITFRAGTDSASAFPMAQFRGVNDPITITFSLTSAQAATAKTLRIGLTLAQSSARNSVTVNGKYTPAVPASVAVKTRGITRGVTWGNYKQYEYAVPASALVTGSNKITLTIASGASDPAETFLHASVVFDALELV
jgi:rhamnogalacturonan endolyase